MPSGGCRVSDLLVLLWSGLPITSRQDRGAEDPDVVAARNAVPPTIQQDAGRSGQAGRGHAVDHQLVALEQIKPGGGMQRDRMSERIVDRGNDRDPSAEVTIRADWPQRIVMRVLGTRRVQSRAESQNECSR